MASHLMTRLEIIHKYNPNYVPDFASLCQDDNQASLEKVYASALEKVSQENQCHYKEMVDLIFPFFDVISGKENSMMTYLVLSCLKSLIKEHQDILEKITPKRNELEERCYQVCQKILSFPVDGGNKRSTDTDCGCHTTNCSRHTTNCSRHTTNEPCSNILSLFKEYIFLFIEGGQGEITLPYFDDPSKIILEAFKDFLPNQSTCYLS